MTFSCEFCRRDFAREKTWYSHSCEKKRRWMNRDSPSGRLAFHAWCRFHELSGPRSSKKQTQELFIQSSFYGAFAKFSRHVVDIEAINPTGFVDYVIKNNIPVDKWTQEVLYVTYVRDLTATESSDKALSRTIEWINEWSQKNNQVWYDFFRVVNTNICTMAICNGRISPWVLYNANSAMTYLEACTPEQLAMIQAWAPSHIWKLKFTNNKKDTAFVREMLDQARM